MRNPFDIFILKCDDKAINTILNRIKFYDDYLLLSSATGNSYDTFLELYPNAPETIKEWYKVINGGYLFDTAILSTEIIDYDTGYSLMRLKDINMGCHLHVKMPANYIAFALSSFGDVYCFDTQGSNEIIQWSIIEKKIVYRWSSFVIWLNTEVSTAIDLINDGILHQFAE